jgi:putative lipoic acid-binding regulatory protein
MTDRSEDTLLEFPTAFPIKAMGRDGPLFRAAVLELVAQHATFDPHTDVREQTSRNGNFVSITVTFEAQSKVQLDTLYQALHDHELVMMLF